MEVMNVVGVIEDVHGHKGAVRIRSIDGNTNGLEERSNLLITDKNNNVSSHEVFEVKRYRRNTYLVKFKGLKWRDEVKGLVKCMVAA